MERQLIVMRHAKSSWDAPSSSDHDRPLSDRGRRDAPLVADRLVEISWQPQHLLSSDSLRTRQTAALLLAQWADGVGVDFLGSLYLASADELKTELSRVSDEVETLLVLGHNPGWERVVYRLSGESVTMKTATAALLQAECETWGDAFLSAWDLKGVVYPRDLS